MFAPSLRPAKGNHVNIKEQLALQAMYDAQANGDEPAPKPASKKKPAQVKK